MHPAVGLLMERVVPKGGADVGGVVLPEGTIVGMNPWVAARDKTVYGRDAYEFRPERWLEADEKQLKLMERNFLAVSTPDRYFCKCILHADDPAQSSVLEPAHV